MKKINSEKASIIAVVVILVLLGNFLLLESGMFAKEPVVEVRPDNCYDKTLTVITDEDYSPYSFYDARGKFSGHDVELIILIANKLHMNLDLRFMEWYKGIAEMSAGKADILMTCDYSDTFPGVDKLTKSQPISFDEFIVYAKKKYTQPNELYGKRIAVMKEGNVTATIKMMELTKYCVEFKNNRDAMEALLKDKVDVAVMRQNVGAAVLKDLNATGIDGRFSVGGSYMCFGIRNNDKEFAAKINGAIEEMKISGELTKLRNKWLTTFVRRYTLAEVLLNNVWIAILFVLFSIILILMAYSQSRQKAAARELIEGVISRYNIAYKVNLHDESYVQLKTDPRMLAPEITFKDFGQIKEFFFSDVVYAADREHMQKELDIATIREKLNSVSFYTVKYRALIDGKIIWNEMVVDAVGKDEVVVGFAERDTEIVREYLQDKMSEDFFAIYEVNFDANQVKLIRKKANYSDIIELGEVMPFTDWVLERAEHYEGEMHKLLMQLADPEYVSRIFKTEDKMTFSFSIKSGEEEKWITATMYAVARNDEGIPYMLTIGLSYTDALEREKQEMQQRLREALELAKVANQAKTSFLFNMSHDIRTPMNAIKGFTAMAKKYVDNKDKVIDCLDKIDLSGQQLLVLINQVLEMARIESGKMELDTKPVKIKEEFDSLVTVLAAQAKDSGLDFHYHLIDVVHNEVLADEAKMGQITLNIAGNALKYTPRGGSIDFIFKEIPCAREGYARYVYTVADTGIGMSKEFMKTLFDPFTREKTSTVSHIQGTGLGMSIVKNLVDILGGKIEVQSEQGKGTRFDITVDFRIADGAKLEAKPEDERIALAGHKVLLVEDNDLNREIATDILETEGMQVESAADGRQAVDVMAERGAEYFDFILMDIQMPFMDGYEATKKIRELFPDLKAPIIALSANAFEEDRQKSLAAGMNDHVAKPIDVEVLEKTMARFL